MHGFLFRFWLICCTALFLAACTSEPTTESLGLIQAREWRMDASGQDTLADAQQATDWQALPPWKGWGFGPEPIWVRLQLRPAPTDTRTPWVVRIRPAFLDDITLYDPAGVLVVRTGDAFAPDADGLSSINFTVQIPALAEERSVYLRMASTSTRTLNVEVLSYGQAQQANRLQEWLMGFVIAASGIFALWAGIQWWSSRDKVMGAFAIKQVLATAWAFFVLGFARVAIGSWFPEGMLTAVNSTIAVCLIAMSIWFFKTLIEPYRTSPKAQGAIKALALGVWASLLLQAFGQTQLMLKIANASVLLFFPLVLLAMVTALPHRVRQPIALQGLIAYMVVYGTLNSLPLMIALGLLPAHPITLYGNLAHATLDGFVMFVMLQVRARSLRREQLQTVLDLQHSQHNAEIEKGHREEQSQLFAMLAHEMKTPLATLRMWMEAGQLKPENIERAIADMNSVIDRCVHTGQLADQGLQASVEAIAPWTLTRECIANGRCLERARLSGDPALPMLYSDAQMLSIVLGNLLDNACKYGDTQSPVDVTLTTASQDGRRGWQWEIKSKVGAAGLPDPERLFEKYYRSPHARRQSGSGLGLFLVKGLLGLMQGQIHYRAEDGHAVFTVWLPDLQTGTQAPP